MLSLFLELLPLAGVWLSCPAESRADESAVALPRSEASLGICTVSLGRPAVGPELVRNGGLTSEPAGIVCARVGAVTAFGGAAVLVELDEEDLAAFDSSCAGADSGLTIESVRGDILTGGGPTPKWRASTEPRSSMGVKMLRDLDGWPSSILTATGI